MCIKRELQQKLAINSLKNIVKNNMPSFSLVGIYSKDDAEIAYYSKKAEEFLQQWRGSELDTVQITIGNNDDDYYSWVLSEISNIGHTDEWLISKDDYWAKVKATDRLDSIKGLWHMSKPVEKRLGYSKGFLAVNTTIGLIIDVGVYSGSENNYTLTTQEIKLS